MMQMKQTAAAVLLALSALSVPHARAAAPVQPSLPPAAVTAVVALDAAALEADVNAALKAFDVPGIAVAIVKDGQIVSARGYGVRKLGDPAPVTGKTLFEVASNSKAFTAAALAMLVDEGKLNWDDPVTQHLPGFQMYDAYVTKAMTVRDLLTHRSGLGLGAGDLMWWPSTTFSSDEIIANLRHIKPATSFRNSYAYDNLLYIVAGKIIADKAGKPWGDAVRERILTPLGMTATTTNVGAMLASSDYSAPHSKIGERIAVVKPMPVPNAEGAVGINTNAEELARWMNVLLDGGKLDGDGKRLLSEKQLAEMWTPQTPVRIAQPKGALAVTRPNFNAYGLGFYVSDYLGRKLVSHGGALQGFYSKVVMVPQERLGIAILTNAENSGAMAAIQWRILDRYLNAAPQDWVRIIADQVAERRRDELAKIARASATRAAKSQPSLALSGYDGEYEDPWYGKVTIRAEGPRRVMRFTRTPDLTGVLEHFQHDTFIVRWNERNFNADAYVTFSLNPDGSIERMKMAPVSAETDFSYDFADLLFTPVKAK